MDGRASSSDSRFYDVFRRRVGAMLVDNAFRTASAAGKLHPMARPERHGVEVIENLHYREGSAPHKLDVYRPKGRGEKLPIVLYVHGGGFRILSKDSHWIMALAFARQGYLVFNIDYRLAPEHPYPAAIQDCCEALAWVVKSAARFGGDPARIAFAGESAGANLITALAVATTYARSEPWARAAFDLGVAPRAVLPACGVLQVSDPDRFMRRKASIGVFLQDRLREVTSAYLGGAQVSGPGALDLADPLLVFERGDAPDRPLPPFFVPVGTKDPLLDDSRRLKSALDRMGVRCEARYYPGEFHAFHALFWRDNARRCWQETFAFLREHM
jgi:acetyl esterase